MRARRLNLTLAILPLFGKICSEFRMLFCVQNAHNLILCLSCMRNNVALGKRFVLKTCTGSVIFKHIRVCVCFYLPMNACTRMTWRFPRYEAS